MPVIAAITKIVVDDDIGHEEAPVVVARVLLVSLAPQALTAPCVVIRCRGSSAATCL